MMLVAASLRSISTDGGLFILQGAVEMAQMEHILNAYTSRVIGNKHVADFVGYSESVCMHGLALGPVACLP